MSSRMSWSDRIDYMYEGQATAHLLSLSLRLLHKEFSFLGDLQRDVLLGRRTRGDVEAPRAIHVRLTAVQRRERVCVRLMNKQWWINNVEY